MEVLKAKFAEAVALHRANDLEAAVSGYLSVLREAPDLNFVKDNLCQAFLAMGDYRRGFALYDVRFYRSRNAVRRPLLPFPEWKGESLVGRSIVIFPEQGFGDQIMMARFIGTLNAAEVTLVAPPPLVRLFASLEVTVRSIDEPVPRHDYWCMLGSLPGRQGITIQTLPADPYLPGGAGSGVGIAWRGRSSHHNDANRSLSRRLADQLLALPEAISLDPDDTGARDFQDTAEIISRLGLVISVDTAVAHLAGAMGSKVWTMVPAIGTDWRWMRDRTDSPWYPSMRLFRQREADDWEGVVSEISSLALRHAHKNHQQNTGSANT